jgi:hypothetical protein
MGPRAGFDTAAGLAEDELEGVCKGWAAAW